MLARWEKNLFRVCKDLSQYLHILLLFIKGTPTEFFGFGSVEDESGILVTPDIIQQRPMIVINNRFCER